MGDRGRFHPFPNLLLLARRAQNGWGQREGVPEKISLGANARDCQDRFPKRCFLLGILLSVFFPRSEIPALKFGSLLKRLRSLSCRKKGLRGPVDQVPKPPPASAPCGSPLAQLSAAGPLRSAHL